MSGETSNGSTAAVKITDVLVEPDVEVLHGAHLSVPTPGAQSEIYAFDIAGWVVGRSARVTHVAVVQDERTLFEVPVDIRRPDIGAAFPDVKGAHRSGFTASVGALSLQSDFELVLRPRLQDGL